MKTYSNETGHTVSRSGIRSISQMCGYDRARGPQRLARAGISTIAHNARQLAIPPSFSVDDLV